VLFQWTTGDEFGFFSPEHDEEKYDTEDVKERMEDREEELKQRLKKRMVLCDELPSEKPVLRRQ